MLEYLYEVLPQPQGSSSLPDTVFFSATAVCEDCEDKEGY